MKNTKLFALVIFCLTISSPSIAAKYFRFKYESQGESLGSILEKFVIKEGRPLDSKTPMIKKIVSKNRHISSWRLVERGTVITLFVDTERAKKDAVKKYMSKHKQNKPRKKIREDELSEDLDAGQPAEESVSNDKIDKNSSYGKDEIESLGYDNFFQLFWRIEYSTASDQHGDEANTPLTSFLGAGFSYDFYFGNKRAPFTMGVLAEIVKYQSISASDGITGTYDLSNALNWRVSFGKAGFWKRAGLIGYVENQMIPVIEVANSVAISIEIGGTWFGAGLLWNIKTPSFRFKIFPNVALGSFTAELASRGTILASEVDRSGFKYGMLLESGGDTIFLSADAMMMSFSDKSGNGQANITAIIGRVGRRF